MPQEITLDVNGRTCRVYLEDNLYLGIGAAVANAVFDAVGICLRQIPFTRERVKAALNGK